MLVLFGWVLSHSINVEVPTKHRPDGHCVIEFTTGHFVTEFTIDQDFISYPRGPLSQTNGLAVVAHWARQFTT